MMGMIDVHRLSIFRSVVATGSVQGAARALNYTPSAVSQHITALQKETGLLLLERSGRGLVPTDAGLAMAEQADRIMERMAEAESLAADLKVGRNGVLSLGYFSSLGETILPAVMSHLIEEFPSIRFDLRLLEHDDAEVEDPKPDVHVVIQRPDWRPRPGWTVTHRATEPFMVAFPVGHRLESEGSITLSALRSEPWIDNETPGSRCGEPLRRACAAEGFSPTFAVEARDYRTALAFTGAGLGVTMLARMGATHLPEGVRAREISAPELVRTIYVTVRQSAEANPAAERAAQLLGAALTERVDSSESCTSRELAVQLS